MEDLFLGVAGPSLIQALPEATNDIFWCVSSPLCLNIGDILFHVVDFVSKTLNGESIIVTMVTVANETDSDFELALVVIDNILHNLFKGVLGSTNPRAH